MRQLSTKKTLEPSPGGSPTATSNPPATLGTNFYPDLVVGLPNTVLGNFGIAVFVDRLSKPILISPISDDTSAPVIAKAYFDTVFRH
jgi:hypothetical protein